MPKGVEGLIEVRHLVKTFPVESGDLHAVNDVSFEVHEGEIYGIIGLSGAGKSTLIRTLNRLEEPTSGTILIDGVDVTRLKGKELLQMRKNIGMIFQSFNLFSQKTVWDNIAYPLQIDKLPEDQVRERVENLLGLIGLADRREAYPAELSGGQKQRVAIARAIARSPRILLSDEGTSALDPKNTAQVLDLLRQIRDQFGTTIIMITHQMEVAKEICDRIAVMEDGRMVEENETRELFLHPRRAITRSLISRLQDEDDENLLEELDGLGNLYRLTYEDESAHQPAITQTARELGIDISILSGDINTTASSHVGYLVVQIDGDPEQVEKAVTALKSKKVNVEALN